MTALLEHLASGLTTVCRCWAVVRRDGVTFGFTDHDRALDFDGISFRPDAGMSARAIATGTGLAVDNTEAMGVLSDSAITEADIDAGRFDGAEVRAWLVNWRDVTARMLRFRGTIGELRRVGGAFHADLRGLSEALNQPQGRVYQKPCAAVLGDGACRVDMNTAGYVSDRPAEIVDNAQEFRFAGFDDFSPEWFTRGRFTVTSGAATGLVGLIKRDRFDGSQRVLTLWQPLRADVMTGDMLRIEAGCDKRAETCRLKFDNFVNFQGFPDIPGEDWLMSVPSQSGTNSGGSLRG
ncbi:DUF2163 domain-containing protein [Octadecabacter sp. SW4]|uniref:DUF2163 domain-containing protein n=1 Tax=Octadecabacter sp. SW4 TaxID=2602067 RepID=UPI0011C1D982|nr:DUF2163 domain-containing protein [Octadecabacter sp. SW4]QEE35882.1 DUF2163 domain-containing protein [Octadecabacter sp. SW4]